MALQRDAYIKVRGIIYSFALLVAWFPTHQAWAEEVLKDDGFIMHHVKDAHEWALHHRWPYPHYTPTAYYHLCCRQRLRDIFF
jgi:hypothetical protein